jgi:membrane protein
MKYKHRRFALEKTPFKHAFRWLKRVRFKNYGGISLYQLVKLFIHNVMDDDIMDRANSVAFNFILAIFPAIIFLFTLIPYITPLFPDVTHESILQFLGESLPPSMFEVISPTVMDIVSNQRGGLLSFGFVLSIWLSTNGTMALIRAFNACYRTIDKRSAIKTRLIATGLTFNLAFVVVLAILLLVAGQLTLDYVMQRINIGGLTVFFIFAIRFFTIFLVFFLAISMLYYFGPAIHEHWKFFSLGSLFSTLSTLGVSYGFSYYITNFATYNKVYGSIGVLIALMIWVQLVTIVLLMGYEINATIHDVKRKHALEKAKYCK